MKRTLFLSFLASASLLHANPEVATVITQEYGAATADGIVLLQSAPAVAEPDQWMVYAMDPFRPGEMVRAALTLAPTTNSWAPKPNGAGDDLLTRVPTQAIDFTRVRFRTLDARRVAQESAVLSKTNFVSVVYQLAANTTTGVPEWGLALLDGGGLEVGFIVVSAETGAVTHQQWGNLYSDPTGTLPPPGTKGEKAADDVRRTAREAWERTGDTGVEVGRFFKRLFKNP